MFVLPLFRHSSVLATQEATWQTNIDLSLAGATHSEHLLNCLRVLKG